MTSPWGNPPQLPNPPRRCDYCDEPAVIVEADGAWCTPEHQTWDRQSEIRVWRKAFAPPTRWSVTADGVEASR